MKRKIVFVQPSLPGYRKAFYDELAAGSTYTVEVYASKVDYFGVKSVHSEKLIEVGGIIKFGPFFWQRGLSRLNLSKNDVLVISGNPRFINHMMLLLYYRLRGLKVIWWGQGWTARRFGILSKLRIRMMNLASGIAVYTEKEQKKINKIVCKPIIGLNNGLDSELINEVIDRKENKEPVSDMDTIHLLFIGRVTKKSKLESLIRIILSSKAHIVFHIIGDGNDINSLKQLVIGSNSSNKVIWYGAIYDEDKVADIALSCDYFIYPGSVGLSLIHAFNYFLPAIITKDEKVHMPEYAAFVDEYNGIGYNDEADLEMKLEGLKKPNKMKINAKNSVKNTYNVKDMASRMLSLIDSIK